MRPFRRPDSLLLRISSLLFLTSLASAVCYYPNQYSEDDQSYQPCVSYSGATSMCCGTNRTIPSGGFRTSDGFTADKCLENGLCENDWKSTDENGTTVMNIEYFRDSCTTTDWKNGGCLNICTEQTNPKNGSSTGFVQVTPCDGTANSTTWCCGKDNSCCDTPAAVTIAQTLAAQTSTVASISTASATSNPTTTHSHASTQTTTSSSTPSSSASSGLSDGAKAGIGVGVGVGVIALFAVAFFFVRRRHGNRANGAIGGNSRPAHDYSYVEAPQDFNQGVPVQSVPVYEKGAGPDAERFELPSDPAHGNGN